MTSTSSANGTALPSRPRIPSRLTARSARSTIEKEVERLIGLLDARDPDPDVEPDVDYEPSIGTCDRDGHVDVEGNFSDDEPWLGSLQCVDQRRWRGPDCLNVGPDLELQTYASTPRQGLGLQRWEMLRRETAETDRLGRELTAVVSRMKRRERAARRTAR